jgi:acyl-CoA synthetase (AMP-forming)/AMP-acid ligase II/thioesterase domain-containing protein
MKVDAELLVDGSRQPETDEAALATSGTPGPGSDSEAPGPQLGATLGEALATWAATRSEAPALLDATGTVITYGDLLPIVRGIGCDLAQAGLGARDRVGLMVPPGLAGAQLIVGIACHCILVPLNPALTAYELADVCATRGLKALVVPDGCDPSIDAFPQDVAIVQAACATGPPQLQVRGKASQADTGVTAAASPVRPRGGDVLMILRSSGTTGTPKLIPVTHRNVIEEARRMASPTWIHVGQDDRAVCMLPLYYAHGLKSTLLVPLILGASVSFPPAGQGTAVDQWVDVLRPTYLSVAPGTLMGMLDRQRSGVAGPFQGDSLRFVMCSSAYLPQDVRVQAEALLKVPVLEFYGLSEAAPMAANPLPPHAAKPGTVGLPAPGELRLVDERGAPARAGEVGEIVIRGPSLTPGYLIGGATEPEPFVDGWLWTGDLGRIDEDGFLSIVGRNKEVINRGGEKVFPYEVEKALLEHPAVLEAAVFGVPHPRLGEYVGAAVVLRSGSGVSGRSLRTFLAARLAAYKLPGRIETVDRLPRGDTGKVLRRVLAEAYVNAREVPQRPVELLEFELLAIWKRLLGRDAIGVDDDFTDIGGDSLLAADMLAEVEALSGRPYPSGELANLTIRRIAQVLISGFVAENGLLTQVRSGPDVPLFFCHGDFGSRGIYAQKLAALLPEGHPVYLLHYGPEDMRRSTLEEIATAYAREVAAVAGGSLVLIGGWCNGGLAAWHLAHLLRQRGFEVADLLLVETPSLNAGRGLGMLAAFVSALSRPLPRVARELCHEGMANVWRVLQKGIPGIASLVLQRSRSATLARLRGQPPADTRSVLRKAGRLSLRRIAAYAPPPLDAHVTCFVADAGIHSDTRPQRWRRLARQVETVPIPGTHFTAVVNERPALARALAQAMARAQAAAEASRLDAPRGPQRV